MKEKEFLKKLNKLIPNLVYADCLLDSESLEIPIYFRTDEKNNVVVDYESIIDEFNNKLNIIKGIIQNEKM